MKTVFTKEELQEQLKELKQQKSAIRNKRVDALKKFSKGQNGACDIQDIDCQIETIQDKIEKLF
jgi:hypothetical protein